MGFLKAINSFSQEGTKLIQKLHELMTEKVQSQLAELSSRGRFNKFHWSRTDYWYSNSKSKKLKKRV